MSKPIGRKRIKREILRVLKKNGKSAYRPKELAKELGYSDNRVYRRFQDVLSELDEQDLIGK